MGGKTWVRGYLLSFENEDVLKKLDRLEGFDETNIQAANEYNRIRVSIFDLTERFMAQGWVYFMNDDQLSRFDYLEIESGEWKNKKANRKS